MTLIIFVTSCSSSNPTLDNTTPPDNSTQSISPATSETLSTTSADISSATEASTTTASQCKHSYGNWLTTKEATCLDTGEKVRICSKCNYAEVSTIAASGHTTQAGKCDRCGENIGMDRAQEIRNMIEVYEVYPGKPDSAGGVDLHISFANTSDKTIKYVYFNVTPYNAVGDAVKCEIRDYYNFTGYLTGPFEPGYEGYSRYGNTTSSKNSWGEAWYNYSIKSIELNSIRIEYTDGTTFSVGSSEVQLAFADYPLIEEVEKVGYRTGFTHNDSDEQFQFSLHLQNRHSIDLAATAMVDIRFVNSNGVIVYAETYRIDPEDYVSKISNNGEETKTASILISDWDVDPGDENGGTLYYHVYSPDGKFDFPEEKESSYDLPLTQAEYDSYLSFAGWSYMGDFPTLIANDHIFQVSDIDFTAKSVSTIYTNGKPKVHFTIDITTTMIAGEPLYSLGTYLRGRILDTNGNQVDEFEFRSNVKTPGSSSTTTVTTDNLEPGIYTLVFDQVVSDENGLVYNINSDLAGYTAYVTNQVGSHLNIPATYAGLPVTSLNPYTPMIESQKPLKSVIIPASVEYISYESFMNCDQLSSITVDSKNSVFYSTGNCVIEKASKSVILGCGSSIIPTDGSINSIAGMAFYNCKSLKSITIPTSVTNIGWSAFSGCSALESITLHDNIVIGTYAFEDCTSLRSVSLPASMTEISSGLFRNCTALETVSLRSQITKIGAMSFDGCISLKNFTLPSTVKEIGFAAFENCGAARNENGILYVDTWAVGYTRGLDDAIIREGTVGIAEDAFSSCRTLKTASIPDSVIYLSAYAFNSCDELRAVSLGNGIQSLEVYILANCPKLSSVHYNGTKAAWDALPKDKNWMNSQFTVTHLDGKTDVSNIHAYSSHIWWTNISSGQDTWHFNNPYIEGNTLYIQCTDVVFGKALQWKNAAAAGKFSGEVSLTESFYAPVPMTGQCTNLYQNAGQAQDLLLEIPLDALGKERPDELYLRLHAYVDGKLANVSIRFTIEW